MAFQWEPVLTNGRTLEGHTDTGIAYAEDSHFSTVDFAWASAICRPAGRCLVPQPRVSLFVTDLDNTLWDWFHAWNASFGALLNGLVAITGVPKDQLENEIRKVHQQRGTSEYSFLIHEVPSLLEFAGDRDPRQVFDEALHAQNSARLRETSLYDGVASTLESLQKAGVQIVAYTESQAYWTEWRIRKLGLDGVIHRLYSSPDHDFPEGITPDKIRYYPESEYGLKITDHRHVARGLTKPNGEILREIMDDYAVLPEEVLYIGDSVMKDVAMAQSLGVFDVHAKYGESHEQPAYEQLKRVSHWPDSDIANERDAAAAVEPNYILTEGINEVFQHFRF